MKESIKIEKVDADRAQKFLDWNTYPGQRPARAAKVDYLIDRLKRGLFLHGRFAFVKWPDGLTQLINGQHQAAMVVRTKTTIDASIQVFELEKGEGEETVAQLFAQFDTEGGRTATDVIRYYLQAFHLTEISPTAASRIASALAELEYANPRAASKDDRAALLGKYEKEARFVFSICGTHNETAKHLLRVPVAVEIIRTYRISTSDAEVFWLAVRDGDMLKRSDPAFRLREALKEASVGNRWESLAVRALCVNAWNAYCRGEELTLLKSTRDGKLPEPIKPKALRRKSKA